MTGKKSGSFDEQGIEGLAKNKPVVYNIEDKKGNSKTAGTNTLHQAISTVVSTFLCEILQ